MKKPIFLITVLMSMQPFGNGSMNKIFTIHIVIIIINCKSEKINETSLTFMKVCVATTAATAAVATASADVADDLTSLPVSLGGFTSAVVDGWPIGTT